MGRFGKIHAGSGVSLFLAFAAFASTTGAAEPAGGVIVVRSTDLPGYRAVEKSFIEALGKPVRPVLLAPGDISMQVSAVARDAALVFAIGPDAAGAAALLDGPKVIYALVPDPGKAGLDRRAPGVPMFVSAGRQVRVLRTLLPRARRVGILFNPVESAALLAERRSALDAAGLRLVRAEARAPAQVGAALATLLPRIDALWLLPDPTVVGPETMRVILTAAAQARVPIVGFNENHARAGALLAVEGRYDDIGRRAAAAARDLLAGHTSLPEAPDAAIFINARTAQALGIDLSDEARARATRVFE
jgi:putative ABC transport system substrate-binding protein